MAYAPYNTKIQQGYASGMHGFAQATRFGSLEIPEVSHAAQKALDQGHAVVNWHGCVHKSKYFLGGHYPYIRAPGYVVETNAHRMPQHPGELR
jgi:hypothetical protein